MSYTVIVHDDITVWFENAWAYIGDNCGDVFGSGVLIERWHETYNNILQHVESDTWKVTFPTEQDYIWFVLKWS